MASPVSDPHALLAAAVKVEVSAGVAQVNAGSEISEVIVYSRGAVITRTIVVKGELPDTAFDLIIPDITLQADPGSFRVRVLGRSVVSVDTRVSLPLVAGPSGEVIERLEAVEAKLKVWKQDKALTQGRAEAFGRLELTPRSRPALRKLGPKSRVESAFDLADLVDERVAILTARVFELDDEIQKLERQRGALKLEYAQGTTEETAKSSRPSRSVRIRFAPGDGGIESATFSYAVRGAARWWPMYSLRLNDGGRQAELTVEALVAQHTGEDWTQIRLGLSTADLILDATLPSLSSLRLGKRQPPVASGYTDPPKGVDRLFLSFDKAFPGGQGATLEVAAVQAVTSLPEDWEDDLEELWDEEIEAPEPQAFGASAEAVLPMMSAAPMPDLSMNASPPPTSARPQRAMAKKKAVSSRSRAGAPGGVIGSLREQAPLEPEPQVVEAEDMWLDFDSLILASPTSALRGKLSRRPEPSHYADTSLTQAQEAAIRMNACDPMMSRGHFDYRYDADGPLDVRASGQVHRLELSKRGGASRLSWRTVPRESEAVYREVLLDNPHDSPLLKGPVDVYVEGSLVTTTPIKFVDKGGHLTVGLGVDERIRVARNVEVKEESAGLLGGRREIQHHVDVELRSSLGFEAVVTVLDRVPVTDDDHVEVELLRSDPVSLVYDQVEREAPIEGGRQWEVRLAPGGQEHIQFDYVVKLRSKDEIVGGNRRD